MIIQNFLDLDTAYFLGLIAMRGRLIETGGDHRIVIVVPSKSLLARGVSPRFDQKKYLRLGANQIRDRLSELLAGDIQVKQSGEKDVQFVVRFPGRNMLWRNLRHLLGEAESYKKFAVPQGIMDAPSGFKKEFMRGVADAGGFIRNANNYMGGKRRVYLEMNNANWTLPIQLCRILQQDLSVPVQLIQWGHPNTRTPGVPRGTSWAKEHQIKIFAEHFLQVGFYIDYKQQILEEFAAADRTLRPKLPPFCNPNPKVRRVSKKAPHGMPDRAHHFERCRTNSGLQPCGPTRTGGHHFAGWNVIFPRLAPERLQPSGHPGVRGRPTDQDRDLGPGAEAG